MKERTINGYPFDHVRERQELILKTYEYDMPFNYPNVTVWRKNYDGGEFHGVELITHNESSPIARLTRVKPGEWSHMQLVLQVPPETVSAEFRLDVADMLDDETLWIADPQAVVISDNWNEHNDFPENLENLLTNPTFSGDQIPPCDWKMDAWQIGSITRDTDPQHNGVLRLKNAQISLYSEIPTIYGQRLVYSLWVRSTNPLPKTVWLFTKWKAKNGQYLSDNAGDCIIIQEEEPIVRVAVIGSACTPPGYVTLEAEPCEEFYDRGGFIKCTAPVRFRQGNLWGMHLRADQWGTFAAGELSYEPIPEGMVKLYPGTKNQRVKLSCQEVPFTGMSCAIFEIPKSRKVIIQGGSENIGWLTDNSPDDNHYSFRTIRTTVAVNRK